MPKDSTLVLFAPDIHYPVTHWPTFKALLSFLDGNHIDKFIFGGDMFDNLEISPHTKGKHKLRFEAKTLDINAKGFDQKVLKPIEARLDKNTEKIWIDGNHDNWLQQYIEEHPEVEGSLERQNVLRLEERGWEYKPCGQVIKHGKLMFAHGETLSGFGNQVTGRPAKKAVDCYCGNIVFAHFHTLDIYTKVMPFDDSQKWIGVSSPCIGDTNAHYLRNRPTSFLNGFVLVEFRPDGSFNIFPIVVTDGQFSYAGKTYKGK